MRSDSRYLSDALALLLTVPADSNDLSPPEAPARHFHGASQEALSCDDVVPADVTYHQRIAEAKRLLRSAGYEVVKRPASISKIQGFAASSMRGRK
jgi:hypothetical protein